MNFVIFLILSLWVDMKNEISSRRPNWCKLWWNFDSIKAQWLMFDVTNAHFEDNLYASKLNFDFKSASTLALKLLHNFHSAAFKHFSTFHLNFEAFLSLNNVTLTTLNKPFHFISFYFGKKLTKAFIHGKLLGLIRTLRLLFGVWDEIIRILGFVQRQKQKDVETCLKPFRFSVDFWMKPLLNSYQDCSMLS